MAKPEGRLVETTVSAGVPRWVSEAVQDDARARGVTPSTLLRQILYRRYAKVKTEYVKRDNG